MGQAPQLFDRFQAPGGAGVPCRGDPARPCHSRDLIRIWVAQYETGAFDHDAFVAEIVQAQEARIVALEPSSGSWRSRTSF
jgi:hypothetical protein